MHELEEFVEEALIRTDGRISKAASLPGISDQALRLSIMNRHRQLLNRRRAVIRRRKSIIKKIRLRPTSAKPLIARFRSMHNGPSVTYEGSNAVFKNKDLHAEGTASVVPVSKGE